MVNGRERAVWARTAALGSWTINMWSKKRISPSDLNPYAVKERRSEKIPFKKMMDLMSPRKK